MLARILLTAALAAPLAAAQEETPAWSAATARQVASGASDEALLAYANDFFEANLRAVDPANTKLTVTLPNNNYGGGTLKLFDNDLSFNNFFRTLGTVVLGNGSLGDGTTLAPLLRCLWIHLARLDYRFLLVYDPVEGVRPYPNEPGVIAVCNPRVDPQEVTLLLRWSDAERVRLDVRWRGCSSTARTDAGGQEVRTTIATLDALAAEWGVELVPSGWVLWMVADAAVSAD